MKIKISAVLFFALASITSQFSYAGADDIKWVAQCLDDNKNEGKSLDVVKVYCECMNDKMSENETLSITQWEKTHPTEEAECDKKAGWK
jgi:hypothetical protein